MKAFQFDGQFIIEHMDELIHLEDYVPISFIVYDKHHERDDFLRSKNLLSTMREMDQLLDAKCKHSKNPINAYDSIIIEWLGCHPEFEGIIAAESFVDYQNMKNNNDYVDLIDLFYDVKLPSERRGWEPPKKGIHIRDDSTIQLPNFKKVDEIYDKYGASLLACYLSYLV